MKITKSQLKQIIKEELQSVAEMLDHDSDKDGASDAKEMFIGAFKNYARELFFRRAAEIKGPIETSTTQLEVEQYVIDELCNPILTHVRKDPVFDQYADQANRDNTNIDPLYDTRK
tara:strand:+ start:2665 stop:3012 length:348 start_codon:yes stop_codon:yes gene_type:complete